MSPRRRTLPVQPRTSSPGTPYRRAAAFPLAVAALVGGSVLFYLGQNAGGRLGGAMSLPKLLWLDYALIAWFLVPFWFWRSRAVALPLRRIYGVHLAGFLLRGVLELYLLYVTRSWIPPYGIAHDLYAIAVITVGLLLARRRLPETADGPDRAARRFLASIRIGLCFEILFAWLFYQAVEGQTSCVWFAGEGPEFMFINGLTWAVVIAAYADLAWTVRLGERVFLPPRTGKQE